MTKDINDLVIIGGGLSGLVIAYLLRNKGLTVKVVEAGNRLGGRIYTHKTKEGELIDLGAAWVTNQHKIMLKLIEELNLPLFDQVYGEKAIYEPFATSAPQLVSLPQGGESTYRIQGGTSVLIDKLYSFLNPSDVLLNEKIKKINSEKEEIVLTIHSGMNIYSKKVISTLPPNLLVKSIQFHPSLPDELISIAQTTHTWMGESIKVAVTFNSPCWNKANSSGTIFSNAGPIPEMYEHNDVNNETSILKGFFNNSYSEESSELRKDLVIKQLTKYYGEGVNSIKGFYDKVWSKDELVYSPYEEIVLPHQNNGHPVYKQSYLEGRFFISGAETASSMPGYMEGAIISAYEAVNSIEKTILA